MSSAEANRPIVERFFEALDALVTMSKIKSIRAFCASYGIDRRNLDALRKSEERNLFLRCGVPWSAAGCGAGVSTPTYC